ncbi:DivIVA domain-containing protein [Arcanobacterium bovis]|uniref:Cell wall synthesis protein Wag31 n=1 Tax=Arcanobacterium bovis TaxID=2529275 RepID=A0A4Q9V2I1_9ACTO|nr:DivIVA domain-containing protein [Arcanobacterium bovis]TBW22767.1 DivIVA domain-containing protein [Arcanobacterium bovis]
MAMLTENDVVNMRFKAPKSVEDGYDQDEVDFFLDEVAETIAQLTKEKAELEAQLKSAQARVTELENAAGVATPQQVESQPTQADSTASFAQPVTDEAASATGVLSLAQRLHDEYVANGKAESERIITEAEAERTRIIADAEDNYNRTLTKLEEERSLLERKISELREFERDYRTRLKSYLESLLSNVESNGQGQTGQI